MSYGRTYIVDYVISVPNNFEISVNIVNGTIEVESINNCVEINNVNGTVKLKDIVGSTTVSLVNGQIKSKQSLPLNGSIILGTVNGEIELQIPQSTSADFLGKTVSGTITSSNLNFQNSVVAPLSLSGILGSGQGTIKLGCVNGNIYVSGF